MRDRKSNNGESRAKKKARKEGRKTKSANEVHEKKIARNMRTRAAIGKEKWTAAEIDQLRRKLLADHGAEGKTGSDYIADVLQPAGWKVVLTAQADAEAPLEGGFQGRRRSKNLGDAEGR